MPGRRSSWIRTWGTGCEAVLAVALLSGVVRGQEETSTLQYVVVSPHTTNDNQPGEMVRQVKILGTSLLREEYELRKLPADGKAQPALERSFVVICDAKAGKKIWLNHGKKVCHVVVQQLIVERDGTRRRVKIVPQPDADFGQEVRRPMPPNLQRLAAREIDGRMAIGYREVDWSPSNWSRAWTTTWWIDSQTQKPLEIERKSQSIQPDDESTVVYRGNVFDAPLDPALFGTEPPQGYSVVIEE
jgi:hypothetical protein